MRGFQRMPLTKILMLVADGVLAGAIVSSFFVRGGLFQLSLLVAAILGSFLVWRRSKAQNRRRDRPERARPTWRTGAEGERVVATPLDRLPAEFVDFHDFNTARGNFDHW